MKSIKLLFFVSFFFLGTQAFSQHDFLKINLDFSQAPESNPNRTVTISLYKQDSIYLVSVKSKTIKRNRIKKTESNIDTVYVIKKEQFERVLMEIEKSYPLKKEEYPASLENIYIFTHPNSLTLSVKTKTDEIRMHIVCPTFLPKERNLEQFLDVCKEILLLAKMNPKKIL